MFNHRKSVSCQLYNPIKTQKLRLVHGLVYIKWRNRSKRHRREGVDNKIESEINEYKMRQYYNYWRVKKFDCKSFINKP